MTESNRDNEERVKEGEKPANFEFFDLAGKKQELDEIIGKKKIVIYFYPKDFTPGCTIEAEEFSADYQKFKENGIEIIGISPDSYESHVKFREKMSIPYMLASDQNNSIAKKYGVYGPKKFMGKEYHGVNRSTFLLDKNGKITKIYEKVKPAGHSKEILEYFIKGGETPPEF
jgi:thioredoxin-dependent peroxiredoxin